MGHQGQGYPSLSLTHWQTLLHVHQNSCTNESTQDRPRVPTLSTVVAITRSPVKDGLWFSFLRLLEGLIHFAHVCESFVFLLSVHWPTQSYTPVFLLLSCAELLSRVRLFVTPWTVTHQAPLSMGFSRREHWSGLPCPPPGDLPNPEIQHRSY